MKGIYRYNTIVKTLLNLGVFYLFSFLNISRLYHTYIPIATKKIPVKLKLLRKLNESVVMS